MLGNDTGIFLKKKPDSKASRKATVPFLSTIFSYFPKYALQTTCLACRKSSIWCPALPIKGKQFGLRRWRTADSQTNEREARLELGNPFCITDHWFSIGGPRERLGGKMKTTSYAQALKISCQLSWPTQSWIQLPSTEQVLKPSTSNVNLICHSSSVYLQQGV